MPQGNKPQFSVIISAYNVETYIEQCIQSVLEQSLADFELIVVDDGSTDRTGEICDKIYADFTKNRPHSSIIHHNADKVNSKIDQPAIKVVHQSNSGLSAARNTGITEAKGEYLIFLDGDDYLKKDALEIIQNGLESELDLLRYQAQEIFPDGHTIRHEEVGFATMTGIEAFKNLSHYHYTENAWLYAYRREFFVENHFKYAEGRLAEDFGLTPLVVACAKTVKAIPDICYNYRQRENSIMHDPTKTAQRMTDIAGQLQEILPKIAAVPGTKPILHYLVVSFLTGATELGQAKFLQIYRESKQVGLLKYIHPTNVKALPRAFMLKHFPGLFYRVYRLN